jgi:hypothetical protein
MREARVARGPRVVGSIHASSFARTSVADHAALVEEGLGGPPFISASESLIRIAIVEFEMPAPGGHAGLGSAAVHFVLHGH